MKKTRYQLQKLEECYRVSNYPWVGKQTSVLNSLGLTHSQVNSWFCSRRRRERIEFEKRIKLSAPSRQKLTQDDDSDSSSSDSDSSGKSDSSHSNEPLEAANILGQIASQKSLPQTSTPMEIESRMEKDVTTEGASHVDSLPVVNGNGGRDYGSSSKSNLPSSSKLDSCQLKEPVGDHVGGGGVDVNGDGDEDEIRSKMINMLVQKNKRDKAKCQSLLNEIRLLEKSIEDRDKLIDDIKKVR